MRRMMLICCATFTGALAISGSAAAQAGRGQSVELVLDKATAWVLELEQALSAVVAEERFEQRASGTLGGRCSSRERTSCWYTSRAATAGFPSETSSK
jgi:hypothetical protein